MNEIEISTINWGERAREDYGDIENLAESISRLGLINPITIERPNLLRAGGRRLSAAISLEWKTIPCRFFDELTNHERLEVELEENIKRKDLTWQEEVKLKKRINELKKELNPTWSKEDTAKLFGVSERHVRREIELADALEKDPELSEQKDKNTAMTKLRRKKDSVKRGLEVACVEKDEKDTIIHGDAVEHLKSIPSDSIDLVLFDPPFAVSFNKKEWAEKYQTVYGDLDDTTDTVIPIVTDVLGELHRVMKDGAHLYMFYSITPVNYMAFYGALASHEFGICGYPLMWIKHSNFNPQPYHRFTLNYEPCFFAWKGKQRELLEPHNATFTFNTDTKPGSKQHPAQKPPELYETLIKTSSHPGETVLDPMMGSGISLATAKSMGRRIVGIEKENDWYDLSVVNISNAKGGDNNE